MFILVPGGGVEPPRAEARRILSPLRLPVPPSRLFEGIYFSSYLGCRSYMEPLKRDFTIALTLTSLKYLPAPIGLAFLRE
jgi:hypothetical protein